MLNQIDSINSKLQQLFDEIGLSESERDKRERCLYSAVVEALDSYVGDVSKERDELKKQCFDCQKEIQSMLAALKDVDSRMVFGTAASSILGELHSPFRETCNKLQAAKAQLDSIFSGRLARANKFLEELKKLSSKLDGFEVPQDILPHKQHSSDYSGLDLSNAHILEVEQELQRWKEEYRTRVNAAAHFASQIVTLWADLGTPQNEIDSNILNCYRSKPEELGALKADLEYLEERCSMLRKEKESREERLASYKKDVQHLWNKLSEDVEYTHAFEKANRGIGLSVLEEYQKELDRLNEKKRQHIHIFIQDARKRLQDLWAQLYFSEEETYSFTPAWSDIFTDASLDAYESEIERLEGIVEQRRPILNMINQYQTLQVEASELEAQMQDSSRLLARGAPGRLLKEEQTRKRLARQLPRVIQDLQAAINSWEQTYGSKFMINGENFLDTLEEELVKYLPRQTPRRPGVGVAAARTCRAVNRQPPPASTTRSPIKTRTNRVQPNNVIKSSAVSARVAGRLPAPAPRQGVVKHPQPPRPVLAQSRQPSALRPPAMRSYDKVFDSETPVPKRGRGTPQGSTLRPTYMGKENDESRAYNRPPLALSPKRNLPVGNIPMSSQRDSPSPQRKPLTPRQNIPSPQRSQLSQPSQRIQQTHHQWTPGSPLKPANLTITNSPIHGQSPSRPIDIRHVSQSSIESSVNTRIMSSQSTQSTATSINTVNASENWAAYDASSSEDEENDTDYLRWRQNAMSKLTASPSKARTSEFDWDKDTF